MKLRKPNILSAALHSN